MGLRGVAALGFVLATAVAGQQAAPYAVSAGRRQSLIVWRIVPIGPPVAAIVSSLDPVVRSQTAGTFGQTAGSFGTPAGSTGQTSSSFDENRGVPSQTAGSVGQTVGNFGVSLGGLADAAAAANGSLPDAGKDLEWDKFTGEVKSDLSQMDVTFEDVGEDSLKEKLMEAAAGKTDAPDVVAGTPLPPVWTQQDSGLIRRFGLVTVGVARTIPQTEYPETRPSELRVEASVLLKAPHPQAAREFVLWLSERTPCRDCGRYPRTADAAVSVAKSALLNALSGERPGPLADEKMATYSAQHARDTALFPGTPVSGSAPASGLLNDMHVHIDETSATANERFAVVQLRAVVEGRGAFGALHALEVLRVDASGRWRVLQLTPNLTAPQQAIGWQVLAGYGAQIEPEHVVQVKPVSLAAPVNRDARPPAPEFWWDSTSGATLDIVEWQVGAGDIWSSSNMFFVPDENGHQRTRVTGRFADATGTYRWRVWSLGRGGTVALSTWRSVNILAQ